MPERLNFKDFVLYHLRFTFISAPEPELVEFFYLTCLWRGTIGPGARRQRRLLSSWKLQLSELHKDGVLECSLYPHRQYTEDVDTRLAYRAPHEWRARGEPRETPVYRLAEPQRPPSTDPVLFTLSSGEVISHEELLERFRSEFGAETSDRDQAWDCPRPRLWMQNEFPVLFEFVVDKQRDYVSRELAAWRLKKRQERLSSPIWLPPSVDAEIPNHLSLPPGTQHPHEFWAGAFRAVCFDVPDLRQILPHYALTMRTNRATVCAITGLWSETQEERFKRFCDRLGVGYLLNTLVFEFHKHEGMKEETVYRKPGRNIWYLRDSRQTGTRLPHPDECRPI